MNERPSNSCSFQVLSFCFNPTALNLHIFCPANFSSSLFFLTVNVFALSPGFLSHVKPLRESPSQDAFCPGVLVIVAGQRKTTLWPEQRRGSHCAPLPVHCKTLCLTLSVSSLRFAKTIPGLSAWWSLATTSSWPEEALDALLLPRGPLQRLLLVLLAPLVAPLEPLVILCYWSDYHL